MNPFLPFSRPHRGRKLDQSIAILTLLGMAVLILGVPLLVLASLILNML